MNKILFVALIILTLLSALEIYSQPATENKNINTGRVSIAVSPLTILDFEPTVNLQVMYRSNNQYSAAIEVGRIIKPLNKNEDSYTSDLFQEYTGWRFRPEIRFWKTSGNNGENSYLAIQGLIKIAEDRLYYDAYRNTPSGLSYVEAVEQNIHKTVLGLTCLVGKEADLFSSKKFYTDIFTGIGLRYKFFKDNIGTDFSKTSDWNFTNKSGIYGTVALGIRIGLKLN